MLSLYYEAYGKLITVYRWDKIKEILMAKDKICYLKIIAPSSEEIKLLTEELNLHEITMKNFTSIKNIPKIEEYDDYISTVMYDVQISDKKCNYEINSVGIVMMPELIVMVCKTESSNFDEIIKRISFDLKNNFNDACSLYYITLDVLVDNLFNVLSSFEGKLDSLEENLLNDKIKDGECTREIVGIRRNIIRLKKIFSYEQEVLYRISHDKIKFLCPGITAYMKDVFHHLERLNASLQEYNDWASNLGDAYSAYSSSKLNDKLQMLNIIQYLFMPLGFLTGWYGMGFKMPEEGLRYSYPVFIFFIVGVTVSLLIYFKKKDML